MTNFQVRELTLTKPVNLNLVSYACEDEGRLLSLGGIESLDTEEHKLVGEGGEYEVYDADVLFVEGGLSILGASEPAGIGPNGYYVRLLIDQKLINRIDWQSE